MPNAQYNGGRKLEYDTTATLLGYGCLVAQRSAGSHGPVDIWAIHEDYGMILTQCKKSKDITRSKLMELWALATYARAMPLIASWHKPAPSAARRVLLEQVTASGALHTFTLGNEEVA